MNNQFLQVALVVALFSNAVLLGILIVTSSSRGDLECQTGDCNHQRHRRHDGSSDNIREADSIIHNGHLDNSGISQLNSGGIESVSVVSTDINSIESQNVNSSPSTTSTSPNDVIKNSVHGPHDVSSSHEPITEQMIRQFYLKYFNTPHEHGNDIDWVNLFHDDLKTFQQNRKDFVQQFFQAFHGDGEASAIAEERNLRPSSVLQSLRSKRSRRSDVLPEFLAQPISGRSHIITPRHAPTTVKDQTNTRPTHGKMTSGQSTPPTKHGSTRVHTQTTVSPDHAQTTAANKQNRASPKLGPGVTTQPTKTLRPKHVQVTLNTRNTTNTQHHRHITTKNTKSPQTKQRLVASHNTTRPTKSNTTANNRKTLRPKHTTTPSMTRQTLRPKHTPTNANIRRTINNRNSTITAKRVWRRKKPGDKGYNRFNDRAMRRANRIARRRMSRKRALANKKAKGANEMTKIFSTIPDDQASRMSQVMTNVLLPSLVQFEDLVGSHITGMRSALVRQELRLERLEHDALILKAHIHKPKPKDLQSDEEDNKTNGGNDKINDDVDDTGLTSPENITIRVQVFGNDEGSGDIEELDYQPVYASTSTKKPTDPTKPTTTPPTTTTEPPTTTEAPTTSTTMTTTTTTTTVSTTPEHPDANYEQLFHYYATLSQKVDALNNFNILSSTEFNRARDLVSKMDDKVTELGRIHKNLKTRTTIHTHQIKELERQNSKIEASLRSALNTFERMGDRFHVFKDEMDDFKNNIHKVNAEFATYEQISDELRAADAYKAHDILDVRESVMNVENRVNGMYRVLDEGAANIRYEMADMLERVCTINKLVC